MGFPVRLPGVGSLRFLGWNVEMGPGPNISKSDTQRECGRPESSRSEGFPRWLRIPGMDGLGRTEGKGKENREGEICVQY